MFRSNLTTTRCRRIESLSAARKSQSKTSALWRFWASQCERPCFPVRCDFSGRIGVVSLRYAIAGVCLFKVILFAALSKFCEMAAMTICAWVLATPKYRARCNPKSRFIVPKHCSTRKRCLEVRLLKRFCDWRSGRPRTALCRIPSRCLPFITARFALLA